MKTRHDVGNVWNNNEGKGVALLYLYFDSLKILMEVSGKMGATVT